MFSFWSISGPHLGHIFQSASPASASRRGGGGHMYPEAQPTNLPRCPHREKPQSLPLVLRNIWYLDIVATEKTSKSVAGAELYLALVSHDCWEKLQNLLLMLRNILYCYLVIMEKNLRIYCWCWRISGTLILWLLKKTLKFHHWCWATVTFSLCSDWASQI